MNISEESAFRVTVNVDMERWRVNERLLLERLDQELTESRDAVETRLNDLVPGVMGRLVNPLARRLYHAIGEDGVRRRVRAHADVVLEAARDAEARGRDEALAHWTPRALEHEELVHRGNRDHPRHPEVRRMLEAAFAERVDALRTFLANGNGDSYEEAVRAAFPDRAALQALLTRHVARARDLVDLVEAEPGLLRFPRALQGPLVRLARDVTDWYETRLQGQLDAIYARG